MRMSPRKGLWAVAASFAAYSALYWQHVMAAGMPFDAQFSYFAGSCSVICMVLGMLLSTRPRAVETSFGGLDRMYRLHKHLGIAAMLLFLAHFATVPGGPEGDEAPAPAAGIEAAGSEQDEEGLPIDLFGQIGMIGFLLLIVITLNRKIPYHRWIATHRFTGLFFAVVSVHVFLVLFDGEELALFSGPGVALALLLLAGLAAYGYRQLVQPRRRRHAFTLAAVNRLERATELVLEPKDGMLTFEPGQFAFVTIDAAGFREAHPFTISSGAKEPRLRFTMKVAGDYTRRVRDDLAEGVEVDIEGPYGRFHPQRGLARQVWVAGGIGITPFLSVLRTMEPGHGRTIRLYYCVRRAPEALFFDELEARADEVGGVTIRRVSSEAGARISADAIKDDLEGQLGERDFYLCGPKPMVAAVAGGLKKQGVPGGRIHHEEFELR